MQLIERVFTLAEATVLTEIDLKSLHNAIDKGVVESKGMRDRKLRSDDVLLLKLWHGVGSHLATDTRRRLFEAVLASPRASRVRADDLIIVDVATARRRLKARFRLLIDAEAAVHRVPGLLGGEPVFKQTRIPVRLVASMMLDGADRTDLLAGYPKLDEHLLDLALVWVAAHPARGRSRLLKDYGALPLSSVSLPFVNEPKRAKIAEAGVGL